MIGSTTGAGRSGLASASIPAGTARSDADGLAGRDGIDSAIPQPGRESLVLSLGQHVQPGKKVAAARSACLAVALPLGPGVSPRNAISFSEMRAASAALVASPVVDRGQEEPGQPGMDWKVKHLLAQGRDPPVGRAQGTQGSQQPGGGLQPIGGGGDRTSRRRGHRGTPGVKGQHRPAEIDPMHLGELKLCQHALLPFRPETDAAARARSPGRPVRWSAEA